ncbi:PiT family inorganic phosphate transporter [Brevibacterium sanguinis]|uniref:PiT family inorganic phosphate transporter n=2 Tax=Brevibacterium TaxID=1696 RepID=A0A366ILH8_9MICO|nr:MULTISPECIES: inorganic phosphate transporter [Brevibacterium]RBP65653.1 PiT family inorganic phosphate transporter [Brevibacterium sanguinis]RBP72287.1 PiT family inorganic phosphate transporter [Brevibacterium celere]
MELLLAGVIVAAVLFAGSNGFHDAALTIGNAVVGRALSPRWALSLAVIFNFIGALLGEGIAFVVANQIVRFDGSTDVILTSIILAFASATVWSLFTYWLALPVSSTHCLIGGLLGAGVVLGFTIDLDEAFDSVLLPLVLSPILGFLLSWALTLLISRLAASTPPKPLFRGARMVDSVLTASLSLVHGVQDAQKTAALVMVALLAIEASPHTELSVLGICWPVRILIAVALAVGTGLSGWRVVRTLSVRTARMDPVKFAAADATATVLMYTAAVVMRVPVSLTFVLGSAILGTQFAGRTGHVRARFVIPVVGVWLLTIPAAALLAVILGLGVRVLTG